jgi:hypothetical protein
VREAESNSFISGQIEFLGANDPHNFRGTNRLSLASRRFGIYGAQELIMHIIQEKAPKSIHILLDDRSRLSIDSSEFIKAKTSPRGRCELIETLAAAISRSKVFCIEEGHPYLENPTHSSPGGLQTLFEAR